jgi:hypothetical protein
MLFLGSNTRAVGSWQSAQTGSFLCLHLAEVSSYALFLLCPEWALHAAVTFQMPMQSALCHSSHSRCQVACRQCW